MSSFLIDGINYVTRTRKTIGRSDLLAIRRNIRITQGPLGFHVTYPNDPAKDPDRKTKEIARYTLLAPLVAGRRLLDIGSGSFYGAAMMAETAREVVGFERNRVAVWQAKLTWLTVRNLKCLCGEDLSVVKGRFGAERFGAATIINVIEHMPEAVAESLLRQIGQSLSPKGFLVLVTPRDRSKYRGGQHENPDHKKEYSERELEALAARSGYRIEKKYVQTMRKIRPGGETDVRPDERAWFFWVLRPAI